MPNSSTAVKDAAPAATDPSTITTAAGLQAEQQALFAQQITVAAITANQTAQSTMASEESKSADTAAGISAK